jgi:glycosyltransferase involved in cell wall biosynthesis
LVYAGQFRFPEGDAAAARVLGIARAIRSCGWEVTFAGAEAQGREEDRRVDGRYEFDGFSYHSQNELRTNQRGPLARLWRYLQIGKNTLKWLERQPRGSIDALILYNGNSGYHARLRRFVKANDIPLIVDCTEWYDPSSCMGGRFGLVRWDVEATLRYWAPRANGALAISSYLEKHLSSRGCDALRVPPLVDLREEKWRLREKKQTAKTGLQLVFAGHAGKKDYVVNAVRSLGLLGDVGRDIRLVLIGPTREEFAEALGVGLMENYENQLEFTGRLPHREALRRVAECDFSIMLRPNARFAHAGFPTKLVESMACGVPILGNLTSDIGLYLRDGLEGLILEDCTPEAFANGVRRALALSPDQREIMRSYARRQAEESFDYRHWTDRLADFMATVLAGKFQHNNVVEAIR